MADGQVALQAGQGLFVKHLKYQSHLAIECHFAAIGDRDACALLASMLEREQPEVRQAGDILPRPEYPEDPTRLPRLRPLDQAPAR